MNKHRSCCLFSIFFILLIGLVCVTIVQNQKERQSAILSAETFYDDCVDYTLKNFDIFQKVSEKLLTMENRQYNFNDIKVLKLDTCADVVFEKYDNIVVSNDSNNTIVNYNIRTRISNGYIICISVIYTPLNYTCDEESPYTYIREQLYGYYSVAGAAI